jgi:3-oxoacyl-[acyl-carrier protein] reductase
MRILLTGSRGGIGSSIKNVLIAEGHTVIAPTSKDLDLSNHENVKQWTDLNAHQEIDVVIFCAGINTPKDFLEAEDTEHSLTLEVNTNSSREILKALLPGMLDRKFGRVIAISSAYATVARGGRSSYSISKAALEALIRSIAVEYAQCNIIANSIVPGFIETPLTLKNNTQLQIDKILERIPMRRFGSSVEVANLVSFLISEKNTYITGQSIRIDGGFSIN